MANDPVKIEVMASALVPTTLRATDFNATIRAYRLAHAMTVGELRAALRGIDSNVLVLVPGEIDLELTESAGLVTDGPDWTNTGLPYFLIS